MAKLKKESIGDVIFDSTNYIIMFIICIVTIYPFWNLLVVSVVPADISLTALRFLPPRISFEAYKNVFGSDYIASGFSNTIKRTVFGTVIQLLFIVMTAYPLAKKHFPLKKFWTGFIVFTMFFHGGLIPTYLVVKGLNMTDTIWSLILPGLIPTFILLIVRNFFMALPDSLEESARIDGANDITILFRIILPVSTSVIATVVLWQAVWHWNAWFDCLIYITKPRSQVLQIVLRRVVLEGTSQMMSFISADENVSVNSESIKAGTIMVTTLPIVILYPFVQKYFVKGVMVGSLKG